MRYTYCIVSLFLLIGCKSSHIVWENYIHKYDLNGVSDVVILSDGSFILAGHTQKVFEAYTNNYNTDIWVIKMDANGKVVWDTVIGDSDRNLTRTIARTSDNGFLLSAWHKQKDSIYREKYKTYNKNDDYRIIKLDSLGHITWDKVIGGSEYDFIESGFETIDGGFLLSGHSISNKGLDKAKNRIGGSDYWIVKLDSLRNQIWQHTYGGGRSEKLTSAIETSDEGYLLTGYSDSKSKEDGFPNRNNMNDYFIIRLTKSGIPLWYSMFGGSTDDRSQVCIQTSDGGFLLAGISNSTFGEHKTTALIGGYDVWLVKLNSSGDILWQKSYGSPGNDQVQSVQELKNGDLLIGCSYREQINKSKNSKGRLNYTVLKTNAVGILKWELELNRKGSDALYSATEIDKGGLLLSGRSTSFLSKQRKSIKAANDIWTLKYDASYLDRSQNGLDIQHNGDGVVVKFNRGLKFDKIEYYNQYGEILRSEIIVDETSTRIERSHLVEGYRFVRLVSKESSAILDLQDLFHNTKFDRAKG